MLLFILWYFNNREGGRGCLLWKDHVSLLSVCWSCPNNVPNIGAVPAWCCRCHTFKASPPPSDCAVLLPTCKALPGAMPPQAPRTWRRSWTDWASRYRTTGLISGLNGTNFEDVIAGDTGTLAGLWPSLPPQVFSSCCWVCPSYCREDRREGEIGGVEWWHEIWLIQLESCSADNKTLFTKTKKQKKINIWGISYLLICFIVYVYYSSHFSLFPHLHPAPPSTFLKSILVLSV